MKAAIIASSLALLVLAREASAQNAKEVAKKSFPSVVMIVMEDANGQAVSLGSGFFVADEVVASNFHVVEGASRGYVKLVGEKKKYDVEGLAGSDEVRDLVLLSVKGAGAPALNLGDSKKLAVGEEVYAVGNPRGLEGTFSQGIVSSIRELGEDSLLQITAPISPGSSGGPILNSAGDVIGVAVATFKGGQNLNFAVPSAYLNLLMNSKAGAKPLAGNTKRSQQKSILNDVGGKITDGVVGGQFQWDYSTLPDFSFSIRNQSRESVKDVYCLVVFYDKQGSPLDVVEVKYAGVIPAGLARRITGSAQRSVRDLTSEKYSKAIQTKVEFRILGFSLIE